MQKEGVCGRSGQGKGVGSSPAEETASRARPVASVPHLPPRPSALGGGGWEGLPGTLSPSAVSRATPMVPQDGLPARSQHPSREPAWACRLPGVSPAPCVAGRVAGSLSGPLLCPRCPLEPLGQRGALRVGPLSQRRLSIVLQPLCDMSAQYHARADRAGGEDTGECNPSPASHPWPPGASGRALAVWGGVPGRRQTPCGPETVTQAAIMCLFLRIAKVREVSPLEELCKFQLKCFLKVSLF